MKSKKILCKSRYSRMQSAIISLGLIISFLMPLFCGCRMLPADSGEITYTKPKAENVVLDAETGDYYVDNQLLLIAEEGVPTVNVGIIDTMFDVNHEDLKDRFEMVWNNPKSDTINSAYGTHVAGTMAAGWNNKKGITGVMPKAKLYGYSVFGTDTNAIVEQKHLVDDMEFKYALTLLITHNCKVINVSMGRLPSDENASIADKLAELESCAQSDCGKAGKYLIFFANSLAAVRCFSSVQPV